jgi:hypothetical protein
VASTFDREEIEAVGVCSDIACNCQGVDQVESERDRSSEE